MSDFLKKSNQIASSSRELRNEQFLFPYMIVSLQLFTKAYLQKFKSMKFIGKISSRINFVEQRKMKSEIIFWIVSSACGHRRYQTLKPQRQLNLIPETVSSPV